MSGVVRCFGIIYVPGCAEETFAPNKIEGIVKFKRIICGFTITVLTLGAQMPAKASFGEPQNKLLYKLPMIYSDGFIRVVSDTKISAAEGKALAEVVRKAIEFDMRTLSWNADTNNGCWIAIISREYGNRTLHTDAVEPDLFVGGLETYRKDKQRFSAIVAHELGHIIVYRRFGKVNPRLLGWSRPWDEGLAQSLEYRFELASNQQQYPHGCVKARSGDMRLTADDAIWIFAQEKLVARKNGYELSAEDQQRWADCVYPLGRQFIEFIRVDLNDGKGCPDAIPKIGNLVKRIANSHQNLDVEFQNEFGIELSEVQRQFVEHLRRTQKNPALRFQNSIIEPE